MGAWHDLKFQRGVTGKDGVTFSRGQDGCNFYINNKLIKSEIPNDKKKVYQQKCFSLS